jgi:hypothetical protein
MTGFNKHKVLPDKEGGNFPFRNDLAITILKNVVLYEIYSVKWRVATI